MISGDSFWNKFYFVKNNSTAVSNTTESAQYLTTSINRNCKIEKGNLSESSFNFLGEIHKRLGKSRLGIRLEEVFSVVQRLRQCRFQWQLSQQFQVRVLAHLLGTASGSWEKESGVGAVGTHESGHVLDDAENRHFGLDAKADFLPDVEQRNLLRGAHNQCSVQRTSLEQELHQGNVLIRSSWWCVDQQIVHFSPVDVFQELLDHSVLASTSPDDSVVLVSEQEGDAHQCQIRLDSNRSPPISTVVHLLVLHSHHSRLRRSADVYVENGDLFGRIGSQSTGQIRGQGALSDSTLSTKNQNLNLCH